MPHFATHRTHFHSYWKSIAIPLVSVFGGVLAACSANLGQTATTFTSPEDATAPGTAVAGQSYVRKPVKIAVLLPLGGFDRSAAIAKSMKQSAEMALFERNDPNVELVVKDDGGTAASAQSAATLAIAEGANIIVGPLFSDTVPGAALVARQANVPVIALSNDVRIAGNGVYLMSFLIEEEVDRIVAFSVARGKRQLAALIPDNAYGKLVEDAFRKTSAKHNASIRVLERYPLRPNGMLKPAQRMMAAVKRARDAGLPIDALFVPGGEETLPSLGPILAYQGIDQHDIQLLGTGAWDYTNIGREQVFAGGWYAGPDPTAWTNFSERFTRTFGHAPPRLASLSYDAVGYAMTLAADSTSQNPFAPENITRLNGYVGVDGLVQLTPRGYPRRSLAILEVQKFGTKVVDPAPQRIGPQTVSSVYP